MAKKAADIVLQDKQLLVSGDLAFSNVMSLYEKSLPYLLQCHELEFDFSGVKSSQSCGLALMLEWIKFANQHQKKIRFKSLSADLQSIAKIAAILPLICVET